MNMTASLMTAIVAAATAIVAGVALLTGVGL